MKDGAASWLVALGLIFALLSLLVFSAIAFSSSILGDRLTRNPRIANTLKWLPGCVLGRPRGPPRFLGGANSFSTVSC